MARLDGDRKRKWTAALQDSAAPWIACGLDGRVAKLSERLGGMAGLIDWRAHGQVSALLARGALGMDETCLVPLAGGAQSFLVCQFGASPNPKEFLATLQRLQVRELALAESTFPEDFLSKVKQHLSREGIRFSRLEPET